MLFSIYPEFNNLILFDIHSVDMLLFSHKSIHLFWKRYNIIVDFTINWVLSLGTYEVFYSFKVATWRSLPPNTKRLFSVDSQEEAQ